jgi:phosphoribosyl 1,2-cyclic phosphodiesterase
VRLLGCDSDEHILTHAPRPAIIFPFIFGLHLGIAGETAIGIRVSILASGSSGNLTLIETATTRVLVDAGLGKRETLKRLEALSHAIEKLDGIVISHEHSDHVGGLPQVLGLWRTTVYFTPATHAATMASMPASGHKRMTHVEHFHPGDRFFIGDIEVSAFSIPHDAADPVGFTFQNGDGNDCTKVAIVTDLGYMPELVKHHLRGADCLILESNHDLEMLKVGPYPWHIKQRVMSRTGHLSNDAVSEYLCDPESFDGEARYLILAHLSETNNNADVAKICAEEALQRRPAEFAFRGELRVASQTVPMGPLDLSKNSAPAAATFKAIA